MENQAEKLYFRSQFRENLDQNMVRNVSFRTPKTLKTEVKKKNYGFKFKIYTIYVKVENSDLKN